MSCPGTLPTAAGHLGEACSQRGDRGDVSITANGFINPAVINPAVISPDRFCGRSGVRGGAGHTAPFS
ncbi:hypothetical protein GCM10027169_35650 [Gordonia jinhuaensis]|uniref:Uncharacterized protein n=1 Tax=Gordonia jinhuaensis TaxID=1517702 RepID=A0A916WTZ2_9ACTN|nr:hypothetical protein GCM10011489_17480 [Gordonia jinhuaensis]